MKKKVVGFSVFFVMAMAGSLFSLVSWDGKVFFPVHPKSARDPAAIRRKFDFSDLEGTALNFASKKRLLEELKIVKREDQVGLEFGHFVVRGENGTKVFACQEFKKVHLVFEADGFAINGERPKMEVDANCVIAEDINRMAPIWIPSGMIKASKPADGEMTINDVTPLSLKYSNLGDQWPKNWILTSVNLYKTTPTESGAVRMGIAEIQDIKGTPLSLEW